MQPPRIIRHAPSPSSCRSRRREPPTFSVVWRRPRLRPASANHSSSRIALGLASRSASIPSPAPHRTATRYWSLPARRWQSIQRFKKISYDPVKDFQPIAMLAHLPFILVVNNDLPVKSVAEFIKYAKDNPGKLSFGSGGVGASHHLYGELFKTLTGIEMTHVPYKGFNPLHTTASRFT